MDCKEYPEIDERIHSGKLPNGLAVFVVPKPGFHKKYAFFATDYGGADRRFRLGRDWVSTPEGVAHFLEHKMFETKDGNALTALSANGASPNAYTSIDITAYHFECTDMFSENLETLLGFVSTPWFTPESVEKELGIIAQEIGMSEDDPDYCLYYGLMKSLYRHNPIRDSIVGTAESIAGITAETLYDCHRVFYSPSNMALCVVGDVEPAEILEIAGRVLPADPGEVPERDYGARESLEPEAARFSKAMEVSLPMFLAGCKVEPAAPGQDYFRQVILSALSLEILAGQSSPLYTDLYARGLVNSDFSASFDSAVGAAYAMFGGEARDPERVFDEVMKEVTRLSDRGPDPGLFRRIKKSCTGAYVRLFNSFESVCANIIGGHFRSFDAFEALELLSALSEDDVAAYYRQNLIPGNMALSVITPKAGCGPPSG